MQIDLASRNSNIIDRLITAATKLGLTNEFGGAIECHAPKKDDVNGFYRAECHGLLDIADATDCAHHNYFVRVLGELVIAATCEITVAKTAPGCWEIITKF